MTLAIAHGESIEAPPYASLRDAISGAAARFPEGGFIHAKVNAPHRTSTYQETLEAAAKLAAGLQKRGMRPGDGLIINLRNSEDFIPALWASAVGGFVAVPLVHDVGRRFGQKGCEVLAFVRRALDGAATLITDDSRLAASAPLDAIVFSEFAEQTRGRLDIQNLFEAGSERLCLVILTSGATGRPKLVGLSERAVLARWWPKLPDAENASTFLSWSPYDHVMGLGLAAPNLKRKVHLDAECFVANPLVWLDVLEETQATHATMTNFGVSLIIGALEASPGRCWRLDHIRKIGVGAEPISPTLCRRFFDCLAPFGLREDAIILGYGLTECGPVVGGATPFSAAAASLNGGCILLDRPTAGHAVRVVGGDGQILNEDCVGAIEVRGPTMASGYIGDAGETGRLFTADGWLRTGDLGVLRNGKLAVIGREKELIVVNARKYSCQEIEEAIKTRSAFGEVYAAPLAGAASGRDPARGKAFAIFVAVEEADAFVVAEVAAEVREILASTYRFVPEAVALIDRRDVPRTPLGKVRRLQLAAGLGEGGFEKRVHHLDSQTSSLANLEDDDIEREIRLVWTRLLKCSPNVDRDADFFALGGDSILALQLSFLLEEKFGSPIPFAAFPGKVSISEIARYFRRSPERAVGARSSPSERANAWAPSTPEPNDDGTSLPETTAARLHALLKSWPGKPVRQGELLRRVGTVQSGVPVFWCTQDSKEAERLGVVLGARRPTFAMRSGFLLLEYGTSAANALTKRYAEEIKEAFPRGPYILAGNCQGAIVAMDIARQFLREGRKVQLLVIADAPVFDLLANASFDAPVAVYVADRSKFNPHREYRFPAQMLKKLLPAGCRMTTLSAEYPEIVKGDPFTQLAADLEEAIAWSERALSEPPRGADPDSATFYRILAARPELTLAPGAPAEIDLDLANDGVADWEAFDSSGISVGNRWLSLDGEKLVWSDGRTPLKQTIRAGGQGAVTINVKAPPGSGRYLLEVDLIEEGPRWFGEKTSSPLQIPVVVEDQPVSDVGRTEFTGPVEGKHEPGPRGFDVAIRHIRSDIRASSLPGWRKLGAKFALSLAKRALGV
jgi:acyl-CoA synthetase (AMP-forming)/AMP-acid ligase II/acyl carrier protein